VNFDHLRDPEGVFHMPDKHALVSNENTDNVESVSLSWLPVAAYPHARRPNQLPPLPPIHGLDRAAKNLAGSGLYFDESNGAVSLSDEIEVAVTIPKTPLEHPPALLGQPALGDSLAAESENLVVRGHGASITPPEAGTTTKSLQT